MYEGLDYGIIFSMDYTYTNVKRRSKDFRSVFFYLLWLKCLRNLGLIRDGGE